MYLLLLLSYKGIQLTARLVWLPLPLRLKERLQLILDSFAALTLLELLYSSRRNQTKGVRSEEASIRCPRSVVGLNGWIECTAIFDYSMDSGRCDTNTSTRLHLPILS